MQGNHKPVRRLLRSLRTDTADVDDDPLTAAELADMRAGAGEMQWGNYITLDELERKHRR